MKYILNEIVQTVTLSDSSWCARVAEDGEETPGETKKMESKLNLRSPLATKDIIVQAAFNVPFHFSHIHMNHHSLNIFFCQYLGQQKATIAASHQISVPTTTKVGEDTCLHIRKKSQNIYATVAEFNLKSALRRWFWTCNTRQDIHKL